MSDEDMIKKLEIGSIILGIIVIAIGGILAVLGVMNLLGFNPLIAILGGDPTLLRIVSISGYTNIAMAGASIATGIGLAKTEEWGLGMVIVVLTYAMASLITDIIYNIQLLLTDPVSAILTISMWLTLSLFVLICIAIAFIVIMEVKYNLYE